MLRVPASEVLNPLNMENKSTIGSFWVMSNSDLADIKQVYIY